MGQASSDYRRSCIFPIITMVSGGGLTLGGEIRFGVLSFIADDSAWLQEAPLDVETLPVRGAAHFCASSFGVLLRQPSTPYQSTSSLFTSRRRKRSGALSASAVDQARGGSSVRGSAGRGNRARRTYSGFVRLLA